MAKKATSSSYTKIVNKINKYVEEQLPKVDMSEAKEAKVKPENKLLREKKSTAPTGDYNQIVSNKGQVISSENYDMTLKTVIDDDEIRGFISIISDSVLRGGFILDHSNKKELAKAEKDMKKIRFKKALRKIVPQLIIYLHSLVEIDKNVSSNKAVGLHFPEISRVRPKLDEKNKILGWYYKYPDTGEEKLLWKPDEIAHFEIDNITYNFWGKTDIYTLREIVNLKRLVMSYITMVFEKNLLKTHFHGVNVSDDDIENFLDMVYTGYILKDKPMVTVGEDKMEGYRYMKEDFVLPLIQLLNVLRNKILTLLRVPPIIAGTVDNSNRSNSDIQARFAFMNRIKAIHEVLEEDCEYELFPKMGYDGLEIKFNGIDTKELREYIDIGILLMNAGAYKDKVIKWIREKGYDVPLEIFDKDEKEGDNNSDDSEDINKSNYAINNNKIKLDKNSNLQDSRKPQDNFGK